MIRSARRCRECLDTNLCTDSCLVPGPSCQACTNPAYYRCEDLCLHPALLCDGVRHCRRGEDESQVRCQAKYRSSDLEWRRWIWRISNN